MSKRELPIKDWDAISYLRDFISTGLILTDEEMLNLAKMKLKNFKIKIANKEKKSLHSMGLRQCNICGEILDFSNFYSGYGVCKKCTQEMRKKKAQL